MSEHPVLIAFDGRDRGPLFLGRTLARTLSLPSRVAIAYRYEIEAFSSRPAVSLENQERFARAAAQADDARALMPAGVTATILPADKPASALLDEARALDASLIALGSDERGHVTLDVMRRAACPVAIAPQDALLVESQVGVIGVAFDGSVGSRMALSAGRNLAIKAGAELLILAGVDHEDDEVARAAREAATGVERIFSRMVLLHGEPVEELRHAAEGLDILVCGSHGRGRALSRVLGSVSSRLIEHPACPVVVVPGRARRSASAPLGVTTAADARVRT
jgi:nucleotide-binding universal stress UspA family protein